MPSKTSRKMAETDPSLLLVSGNSLHFFCCSTNDIQTLTRIGLPPELFVAGSCNGLLCLWDSLYQYQPFIFNPFTSDFLELPKPKQFHSQHRVASGLGFHSFKNYYKVVRIVYYRTNQVQDANIPLPEAEIQVLTIGDGISTWRNKGKTPYQVLGRPSNVIVQEKLHWLTCKYRNNSVRKIICFDLADEQLREVPSPRVGMFGRRCTNLVSLRGCLSGIVQGYRCLYIWAMKEYGVQDSWIKEYTISTNNPHLNPCFPFNWTQLRVLCLVKNGEILLQYRCKYLVAFDPNSGLLRKLEVPGLPQDFNALVHIGSFNWPWMDTHSN
ncbi:F-box protein At3g07870-like [Euphorbia lathyris]|uniref:F-box protein At3g07870-like n=1 Tax=Euphorbia lathyris TaxID=212925 RepID=UPI003313AD46